MPRTRQTRGTSSESNSIEMTRLWILRILMKFGGHKDFIARHGFASDILAVSLGLEQWLDPPDGEFDGALIRAQLRKLYVDCEARADQARVPATLAANSQRLAELVGLSDLDRRILEFAVLIHTERALDDAADWLGSLSSQKLIYYVSGLLDVPEEAVREALSARGVLARSGLVTVSRSGNNSLRCKLDLLSESFADRMLSPGEDLRELLRDALCPCEAPELGLGDFEYLKPHLDILRPYLRDAVDNARVGVNIFLHGGPGTGKTQLARVLAQELGCELFEVASEDEDGDPLAGGQRLRAYRAGQSIFASRRVLILFDEVEDAFNDGDHGFGRKSTAQTRKAWVNRMLEQNPVPTLWLSNSVSCLDPAFVRRFSMVIELPVPPRKHREAIIRQACGNMLPDESIARIAQSEVLTPAVVAKAASVVAVVRYTLPDGAVPKAIELLIDSTLKAQGHSNLRTGAANRLPDHYDIGLVNADLDLARVADGLASSRSGRICLYGPAGTGKSAFGRWLAERLGTSLHVWRASDLISKWVGESEKNIARAFREAEQERAILLLDEVDSFLQDRRGAERSWQVTQVNEMLTQMEAFDGVFIASTNLMGNLDQAALRRFDLKLRFNYLLPEQAWRLYLAQCQALGLPTPEDGERERLARLNILTPGDFAAVARQHRFHPLTSTGALLEALRAECEMKQDGPKATIGFV